MSHYFISPQVFQTFACEKLTEIGQSFLRADLRIVCENPQHTAYKVYAGIMICVCECQQGRWSLGMLVTSGGLSFDTDFASS